MLNVGEQGAVTMFPLFLLDRSSHDGPGAGLLEWHHRHGILHLWVIPGRPAARSVQVALMMTTTKLCPKVCLVTKFQNKATFPLTGMVHDGLVRHGFLQVTLRKLHSAVLWKVQVPHKLFLYTRPFQKWRHRKLRMHFGDEGTGHSHSFQQVSTLKPLNKKFQTDS